MNLESAFRHSLGGRTLAVDGSRLCLLEPRQRAGWAKDEQGEHNNKVRLQGKRDKIPKHPERGQNTKVSVRAASGEARGMCERCSGGGVRKKQGCPVVIASKSKRGPR